MYLETRQTLSFQTLTHSPLQSSVRQFPADCIQTNHVQEVDTLWDCACLHPGTERCIAQYVTTFDIIMHYNLMYALCSRLSQEIREQVWRAAGDPTITSRPRQVPAPGPSPLHRLKKKTSSFRVITSVSLSAPQNLLYCFLLSYCNVNTFTSDREGDSLRTHSTQI